MLTGTHTGNPEVAFIPRPDGFSHATTSKELSLADVVPHSSQLHRTEPIQTRSSELSVPPPHSDSDYEWLIEVLDGLTDFVRQCEHRGNLTLTKEVKPWASALLSELFYIVGENARDPLASLDTFACLLIEDYEEKHLRNTFRDESEPIAQVPKLDINEWAAHAFFSIGCILWEGGRTEKALAAYDEAIRIPALFGHSTSVAQRNLAHVYNNRGNIRNNLRQHEAALADYDEAIRLNPRFAEAYRNRGVTHAYLSKQASALADLDEATRLKPELGRSLQTYIEAWKIA